ncbi:MAG: hypothetical protein H7A38_02180 [Chlamydiales bacterium]|nr:hypothetical protein [Chlamydiales bacterium]
MECVLCHHKVLNPVAVTDRGGVYHLRAICSYLAQQLLKEKEEANPELMDMGRIPVEKIVQRDVEGRVTRYFPDQLEDCDGWQFNTTPQIQELAVRLMTAFVKSGNPERDLHQLSKARMVEIRNDLLRAENLEDECWLKSVGDMFRGMGTGGWSVLLGCGSLAIIGGYELGRSLGVFSSPKEDDKRKAPTVTVDPALLESQIATKV